MSKEKIYVVAVHFAKDNIALVSFTNGVPQYRLGRPGLEKLRRIIEAKTEQKVDRVKLVPKIRSRVLYLAIPEKLLKARLI